MQKRHVFGLLLMTLCLSCAPADENEAATDLSGAVRDLGVPPATDLSQDSPAEKVKQLDAELEKTPDDAQPGPAPLDQVVLLDVQGWQGGRDLWISADGKAVCRVVNVAANANEPGLQETRYSFTLFREQQASLADLAQKQEFFAIKTKQRPGIPDEARPIIMIKSGSQTHAVGKWDGDEDRRFDPLYKFLLEMTEPAEQWSKIGSGPYDLDWQPTDFPENKDVHDLERSGTAKN